MIRMIVDCDPGHDDAIALMVAHRWAEVVAVTTVSGNLPVAATTENALLVMALLGVETPVYAGAHRPLIAEPRHAAHVHGKSGLDGAPRFDHKRTVADGHAVDKLFELADADTWVVALGPLTNLAHAIERDPSWPRRIAGISLMGGSTSFGNATRVAEFNVWADAEAAARVFSCGANIIQCGLNLTHQLCTDAATVERLREAAAPCATFAADILEALHERLRELVGRNDAPLHDPCAVLALTHPHLIETQPRGVSVETHGELTRGMTVTDERTSRRRDAPNVNVAYRIDAERAMDVVLETLTA